MKDKVFDFRYAMSRQLDLRAVAVREFDENPIPGEPFVSRDVAVDAAVRVLKEKFPSATLPALLIDIFMTVFVLGILVVVYSFVTDLIELPPAMLAGAQFITVGLLGLAAVNIWSNK